MVISLLRVRTTMSIENDALLSLKVKVKNILFQQDHSSMHQIRNIKSV